MKSKKDLFVAFTLLFFRRWRSEIWMAKFQWEHCFAHTHASIQRVMSTMELHFLNTNKRFLRIPQINNKSVLQHRNYTQVLLRYVKINLKFYFTMIRWWYKRKKIYSQYCNYGTCPAQLSVYVKVCKCTGILYSCPFWQKKKKNYNEHYYNW